MDDIGDDLGSLHTGWLLLELDRRTWCVEQGVCRIRMPWISPFDREMGPVSHPDG